VEPQKIYAAEELKKRTKQFAIRIVRLFQALPRRDEARVIGKQVLRSGTSVAANYRAVCRARSKAEFVAKIGVVVEEIDETVFWLELLVENRRCRTIQDGGSAERGDRAARDLRCVSACGKKPMKVAMGK
jgi:four helix bundle protein